MASLAQQWFADSGFDVTVENAQEDLDAAIDDGVVISLREGNETVGIMCGTKRYFFWTKEWAAQEYWFLVHPDRQRQGLAKRMGVAFLAWAKWSRCKSIMLSPTRFGTIDVEAAVPALEKYGFQPYGVLLRKEI